MKIPPVLSAFFGDTEVPYLLYDTDGPTIVLVHATGFTPWQWHPISRELTDRYRIVAPFFCDHRSTDPETGGLRWPILANDLVNLCRHLEIERPFMVGHSMGGGVCILAHEIVADMAQKMILIEPIILQEPFYREKITLDQHPLAAKTLRRRNVWLNYQDVESYLRSKPLFSQWDEEMLRIYMDYGITEKADHALTLTCSPYGEAALFMGSLARDPWPLLPHIQCPVLIIEGGNSESRTRLNLAEAAKHLPNGEHRLIPEAGHLFPMENPKRMIEIIETFFN